MKAKKALGQNFLINENIQKDITSLIDCQKEDLILEIGPGKGAITKYLKKKDASLVCIELDTDLKDYLKDYNVIYDDILNIDLKEFLKDYNYQNLYIVGNLPYYITSPILEHIISSKVFPSKMVFMVQKEVADRFSTQKGTKDYGYMTVYLNHFYDVKKEIFASKNEFRPIPKVDSYVISLTKKEKLENVDEEKFFSFLKVCFAQKRKTLRNNLRDYDISKINLSNNVRAEELSEKELINIFEMLNK